MFLKFPTGSMEDGSAVTWGDVLKVLMGSCKLLPEADDGSHEEVLTNASLNILMGCLEDGSVVLWRVVLKWLAVLARMC